MLLQFLTLFTAFSVDAVFVDLPTLGPALKPRSLTTLGSNEMSDWTPWQGAGSGYPVQYRVRCSRERSPDGKWNYQVQLKTGASRESGQADYEIKHQTSDLHSKGSVYITYDQISDLGTFIDRGLSGGALSLNVFITKWTKD